MHDLIWIDGNLRPALQPAVPALDQGLQLGLSVFDTLLLEDGCVYFAEEHIERLGRSARGAGIPWPPPWDPFEALRALCEALGWRDTALRLTYTRGAPGAGPTLIANSRPLAISAPPGVSVLVSSYVKLAGDPLESLKSTNRLRNVLAREEAVRAGCFEALLPTHEGDLAEGSLSNLFCVRDGVLHTPATARGCLAGVMRDQVLHELEREPLRLSDGQALGVRVERIEPGLLASASEVFLTNTTGRAIPVVEVRGLCAGLPGAAGEVTRGLRERLARVERGYRAQARLRRPSLGE